MVKNSTSAAKSDSEQRAYITVSKMDTGRTVGARVRRSSDSASMTNYVTIKGVGKNNPTYTVKGKAGTKYFLRMQADSSSGSVFVFGNGRFTP